MLLKYQKHQRMHREYWLKCLYLQKKYSSRDTAPFKEIWEERKRGFHRKKCKMEISGSGLQKFPSVCTVRASVVFGNFLLSLWRPKSAMYVKISCRCRMKVAILYLNKASERYSISICAEAIVAKVCAFCNHPWCVPITEYIFLLQRWNETGLVYLPTQLERTLQLYWWWTDGNCSGGGWACTPHPHQIGLILPSWSNVRQEATVASC
jgi:hypothetical protein